MLFPVCFVSTTIASDSLPAEFKSSVEAIREGVTKINFLLVKLRFDSIMLIRPFWFVIVFGYRPIIYAVTSLHATCPLLVVSPLQA